MNDSLTFDSLFKCAKKFAHLALQAHSSRDEELFVLLAGVSIEHLLKSGLAQVNPVLLMEAGALKDDRALLHFAGLRPSAEKIRTVSAAQALARARSAGWLTKNADLDELIELRNGVAHLGQSSPEGQDVLATFASSTDQMLDQLNMGREQYWGNWLQIVQISLDDQLEKVDRDVQRRIEQARRSFLDRYADFSDEAILAALESPQLQVIEPWKIAEEARAGNTWQIRFSGKQCPSCPGEVIFAFEAVDSTEIGMRFSLLGLSCRACGLEISGEEEIAAMRKHHGNIPHASGFYFSTNPVGFSDVSFGEAQSG